MARFTGMIFFGPLFGNHIPKIIETPLSIILAISLSHLLPVQNLDPITQNMTITTWISELFIGSIWGSMTSLLMLMWNMVGNNIAHYSGLSQVTFMGQQSQGAEEESLIGYYLSFLNTCLFWSMGIYYRLIKGWFLSYVLIPFNASGSLLLKKLTILMTYKQWLIFSMKLLLPFIVLTMTNTLIASLIQRFVPNFQTYFLSQPVSVIISILLLIIITSSSFLWIEFYNTWPRHFLI